MILTYEKTRYLKQQFCIHPFCGSIDDLKIFENILCRKTAILKRGYYHLSERMLHTNRYSQNCVDKNRLVLLLLQLIICQYVYVCQTYSHPGNKYLLIYSSHLFV